MPSEAAAAPQNLPSEAMLRLTSMMVNTSIEGSNTPTESALKGAKMILPSGATAAPQKPWLELRETVPS